MKNQPGICSLFLRQAKYFLPVTTLPWSSTNCLLKASFHIKDQFFTESFHLLGTLLNFPTRLAPHYQGKIPRKMTITKRVPRIKSIATPPTHFMKLLILSWFPGLKIIENKEGGGGGLENSYHHPISFSLSWLRWKSVYPTWCRAFATCLVCRMKQYTLNGLSGNELCKLYIYIYARAGLETEKPRDFALSLSRTPPFRDDTSRED